MQPDPHRPRLRMLIAPVRSGTTAFLHLMAQSSYVDTATGVMKRNLRAGGAPDYRIYEMSSRFPFLFYKASFGYRCAAECTYDPFRSSCDIVATRPLFLLRDPVQTLNSWRRRGWIGTDLKLFLLAYRSVVGLFRRAAQDSERVRCLAYEHLAAHG